MTERPPMVGSFALPAIEAEAEGREPPARLRAVTVAELLAMDFPEPEPVLGNLIRRATLGMVSAWRGVGKTHFSLGVAWAVATGGQFMRWKAPAPRGVLYIDGEMPGHAMMARLGALKVATGANPSDLLRILTPDAVGDAVIPDIATKEGQAAIDELLDPTDPTVQLLVLDNLSCLQRSGGPSNDEESWRVVQDWLLRLRRRRVAVLLVHHHGKGGAQRGTSKKEDVLDLSIDLKRPADYVATQGARFEVHITKGRHLTGDAAAPFLAELVTDAQGRQQWVIRDLEPDTSERVVAMFAEGMKGTAIAKELGIHKSTVSRHKKAALEQRRL